MNHLGSRLWHAHSAIGGAWPGVYDTPFLVVVDG
jgi:hypothetical protein